MGIVPKGANHAFQRRGETSKILACGGVCAGALITWRIGTGVGEVHATSCLRRCFLLGGHLYRPINFNQPNANTPLNVTLLPGVIVTLPTPGIAVSVVNTVGGNVTVNDAGATITAVSLPPATLTTEYTRSP